ncbi:MAG: ABC transporter substrate-binding protein [Lautropia sp.]
MTGIRGGLIGGGTRRTLLRIGGALGAGAFVTACTKSGGSSEASLPVSLPTGSALEDMMAAARKEGTIVVYISVNEQMFEDWVKPFSEKFGVKVHPVNTGGAAATFTRWAQEWNAKQYQADAVLLADPSAAVRVDKAGMAGEWIPGEGDKFDPGLVIKGKAYPLILNACPMTWNSAKVTAEEAANLFTKDGLANYAYLTDPRWQGRLAVLAPHGVPIFQAEWVRLVKKYGWGLLEGMARNKPAIPSSSVAASDQIARGEINILAFDPTTASALSIGRGAPVEYAWDDEAAVTAFDMIVANKAPHSNAARLFQEWCTTAANVKNLCELLEAIPGRDDIKPATKTSKLAWYQKLKQPKLISDWTTDPAFASGTQDFLDRWAKTFNYKR